MSQTSTSSLTPAPDGIGIMRNPTAHAKEYEPTTPSNETVPVQPGKRMAKAPPERASGTIVHAHDHATWLRPGGVVTPGGRLRIRAIPLKDHETLPG